MPIYNKGIKHWNTYECRKDYYHTRNGYFLAHYRKKKIRKVANQSLRRYKGEVGNNGWYKRFYDVQWTVV